VAADRYVQWEREEDVPSLAPLREVIEDFVGHAGTVRLDVEREWFCVLLRGCGTLSRAARRQTPTIAALDAAECDREREFEVVVQRDFKCVDVMTRMQDDFTSSVADGLARTIARFWGGKWEREAAKEPVVSTRDLAETTGSLVETARILIDPLRVRTHHKCAVCQAPLDADGYCTPGNGCGVVYLTQPRGKAPPRAPGPTTPARG
jgi:hypothetical protein